VRLVVVVVPVEVGTYVCDHIGCELPTDTVQGPPEAERVIPVNVMVAVSPRAQAAPPLATVRVTELPEIALDVTSVLPLPKDIASGVPVKGRPEITNVPPG